MIKLIKWVLLMSTVLIASACSSSVIDGPSSYGYKVNQADGLEMSLNMHTFTSIDDEMLLIIQNQSGEEYSYDVSFELEMFQEEEWVRVSPKDDIAVIEIAYIILPDERHVFPISLDHYGKLQSGIYRIVKNFSGEPITVEFSVAE